MRRWGLIIALGIFTIGVLIVILIQLPGNEAGPPPTSASYVDSADCGGCHADQETGWAGTLHAIAYPTLINSGHAADYCEPCHSVGAGVPSIYPATGYNTTTDTPAYLQNVSCQACHGPGSEHVAAPFAQKRATIGLVMNASLCGSCHYATGGISSTHHPTYNEWELSGHNTSARLPVFVKQASCSNCHEAWNAMEYITTGVEKTVLREADEDAPITWEIACSTCHDPHSSGVAGTQLRLPPEQICARCHNSEGAQPGQEPHHPMAEMRNNTAGYGIDRTGLDYMPSVPCVSCHMADNNAGLPNHTFRPNPYSCTVCHDTTFPTNESSIGYIEMIGSMTEVGINGAEPRVEEALALIEQMRGNKTDEDLNYWADEYEIAIFNLETVISDSSEGNHNPRLASALLEDSLTRSSNVIGSLTPPEKITGVRAYRLANGSVMVEWNASDASDFAKYRIYVLTLMKSNITGDTATVELTNISTISYLLTGIANNTLTFVYVTAVDTNGNEITNTVTAATVTGNLEEIIADLQQQIADLTDQFDSLQDDNDQLNQDVANLEDKVSNAENARTSWAVMGVVVGAMIGLLIGLVLNRLKPKGAKPEEPPAQQKT